jgi:hypothetical protein
VLIEKGTVYITDISDKILFVVRETTGEILQTIRGDVKLNLPSRLENKLFLHSDVWHGAGNNDLTWYQIAADGRLSELYQGPEAIRHEMATGYGVNMEMPYADGRIYFRTDEGAVAAYDLRADPGPAVTVTAPADGASVGHSTPKVLKATASDGDGVAEVIFYVNGRAAGEDNTPPYEVPWEENIPGDYSIYATATDAKGNEGVSAAVTVSVVAEQCSAPPRKSTPLSPAGGAVVEGVHADLAWTGPGGDMNMATRYEIFLGTDPEDLSGASTVSNAGDTSFRAEGLAVGQTYYWRVDAANGCGTTVGDTRSFTTATPAGFRYLRVRLYKQGGLGTRIYSTQWHRGTEDLVPVLTSNREQGYALDASAAWENAFHLYDGDGGTEWGAGHDATHTIDFGAGTPVRPDSVSVTVSSGGRAPDSVRFEGSYYGTNWYLIGSLDSFDGNEATVGLHDPQPLPTTVDGSRRKGAGARPAPSPEPVAVTTRLGVQVRMPRGAAPHSVRMFDAAGRTVVFRRLAEDCGVLDIRGMPGGLYWLQLENESTGRASGKRLCIFR